MANSDKDILITPFLSEDNDFNLSNALINSSTFDLADTRSSFGITFS